MAALFVSPSPLQLSVRTYHRASSTCSRIRRTTTCEASSPPQASANAEYDVVIIGSGLGGLSAAAVLSAGYGLSVCVLESHTIAGGAAHSFTRRTSRGTFTFDSGPSLFSGIAGRPSSNPLQHVLRAAGVDVPVRAYDAWGCFFEDAYVRTPLSRSEPLFGSLMAALGGPTAQADIARLVDIIGPMGAAATAIPAAALRPGDAVGTARAASRYFTPQLARLLPAFPRLPGPFGPVLKGAVQDPFAYRFVDLLCFLLAGVGADDIVAAEVAFMFSEWTGATAGEPGDDALLECPIGGSGAIVDALLRSIADSATGSVVRLGAPVASIVVEKGAAVGIETARGEKVRARKAVMSNASVWDTARLLPPDLPRFRTRVAKTRKLPSFVHLHLALDLRGSGLEPADLEVNYIVVDSWERGIEAPQNVVVVSVPSAADPSLAPTGHAILHAYTPATEPYELYAGLSRQSDEYAKLKKERCQCLWRAVERIVPDARDRAHIEMRGTPLTHARFLSVEDGSYGPLVSARDGMFPFPSVEDVNRLLCIGQSTFPGIGVPAVAASGFAAANSLVPVEQHLALLDKIGL